MTSHGNVQDARAMVETYGPELLFNAGLAEGKLPLPVAIAAGHEKFVRWMMMNGAG